MHHAEILLIHFCFTVVVWRRSTALMHPLRFDAMLVSHTNAMLWFAYSYELQLQR